jgi:Zn-dependent peptidase ImmA (M78 family)/DNA-binding XRE family transcriptional regulator
VTEVPASPDVLRWARDFRRLSESDAAKILGISEDDLRALEAGAVQPSLTLFETIAAKYRLPQSTLFRRTPPKEPAGPADYRTLGGLAHKESFEFSVALSNVRALLTQLQRVAEDDGEFRPPDLPHYSAHDDPGALGEMERERLGTPYESQEEWADAAEAFRQWRRLIERQGVSVFLQKFPLRDCRGFTLYEANKAPCVVVNKNEEFPVARIFTLLHEYGHLLIRRPGISDEDPANPVEAFCNRFAAGFLMPTAALRQVLPYWPNLPVEWPAGSVQDWAKKFKVSRQALALRLEHVGLAPEGFHRKFLGAVPPPKKTSKSTGNHVATRLSEIGANFAGTVIRAFDRGAISKAAAVDALALSARHFDRVRRAVAGPGLVDARV